MTKSNTNRGPHQAKNKPSMVENAGSIEIDNDPTKSADERNTVILDKDFENLEFDDKVWLWWRENKKTVIASVVIAFALIIGTNSYKYLEQRNLIESQRAYNECASLGDLENFAKTNSSSELGAIASLQVADDSYKNSDFAKAKEYYSLSAKAFGENALWARANIGLAFCEIKVGNNSAAKTILQTVTNNTNANSAYKAEASYQLGLLEFNEGNKDLAKQTLSSLINNPSAGAWASLAQNFIDINLK